MGSCQAVAQPPPASAPEPTTRLAGKIELPRLLDLCSERLKVTIDYDPASIAGAITLRTPEGLSNADLWTTTNRLLAAKGFATIQTPGSAAYSVVKLADAAAQAKVQPAFITGTTPPPPGFQSIIIRPQFRSGKEMADALRGVLTKTTGQVSELGSGGPLVVSDTTPRLEQALQLLSVLDRPGGASALEELPLKHLPASALVPLAQQVARSREGPSTPTPGGTSASRTLGDLFASPGGKSVLISGSDDQRAQSRSLVAQLDRPEAAESRTYTPRLATSADAIAAIDRQLRAASAVLEQSFEITSDRQGASFTLRAAPSQHAQAAEILDRLELASKDAVQMRSFVVRNRPVADLTSTLSNLIDTGVLDPDAARERVAQGGSQRQYREANSPPPNQWPGSFGSPPTIPSNASNSSGREASANLEPGVRLTADEATNTIIAIGEPRLLARLDELIKTIDVRQPQVMLEVLMIGLTDAEALSLGAELRRVGNLGSAQYALASLFGLGSGSASAPTGTGFTGTLINVGEFSVLVRALETINKGRSLSRPRLLVANNQQATFSSVLQQPVTTTNQGNTSTTTSFGGSDDAGTTISVRPQIAAGDHLVLTYQVSLSSFVGNSPAAGIPPPKQQNRVDSVATIPDDFTVVVGGIEFNTDSNAVGQVPLIANVPLIGELFKNRNTAENRSRFYVFIHATILRNSAFTDLKYSSDHAAASVNLPDDGPITEPRVIK